MNPTCLETLYKLQEKYNGFIEGASRKESVQLCYEIIPDQLKDILTGCEHKYINLTSKKAIVHLWPLEGRAFCFMTTVMNKKPYILLFFTQCSIDNIPNADKGVEGILDHVNDAIKLAQNKWNSPTLLSHEHKQVANW